jgi:hypothetical protein
MGTKQLIFRLYDNANAHWSPVVKTFLARDNVTAF